MNNWNTKSDDSIVCYCQNVNKKEIVEAINKGFNTLELIKKETKACTMGNCKVLNPSGKCCSKDILKIIEIHK